MKSTISDLDLKAKIHKKSCDFLWSHVRMPSFLDLNSIAVVILICRFQGLHAVLYLM